MSRSAGIHHITAIAGEPKRHVRFYRDILGLRLVKRTVNFDDPSTWHLYYGDENGSPGTALTFFVWEELPSGRHGSGEPQEIAFAVPAPALEFWRKQLSDHGISHKDAPARFGEQVIAFADADGHKLELVGSDAAARIPGWSNGDIPAEHAIRGFHGITLEVSNPATTARVLTEIFGFEPVGINGDRHRFVSKGAEIGTIVDLRVTPGAVRASQGTGTVHHVAFRASGDEQEMELRKRVIELGLRPTEQVSRHYFRSVYFREPNGILFEIATDDPGFAVDEPKEKLGDRIMLPPWYEQHRQQIVAALPALE
ncbi:MAG: ring-cleaving dioxygenase [Bradyrhizobiaceae bacterium]|nr:ring-cleaving dioxygenase [Bradyrhizobiaceae bacterium]